MTQAITRLAAALAIVFVLVLSVPAAAVPPVSCDQEMKTAKDVDLFDYVRAERSPRYDPMG